MIFIGGPRHLAQVPWRYESQPGPTVPVDVGPGPQHLPIFRDPSRALHGEHGGPTRYCATMWHMYRRVHFLKLDGTPWICLASNTLTDSEVRVLALGMLVGL